MVIYPTRIEQRHLADRLFVLEVIRDLDEAIDLLCESLGPNPDPFAEDLCPYYGILWAAAEGLAHFVVQNQARFKNKTMIEVGCGLAYPSLVAKALGADIIATDFHPDVSNFLARNLRHNQLELPYERFNWRDHSHTLGQFDIVMGSDVLYEPKHPGDVALGFKRLLKPGGEVWLADPGRGYLQRFVDEMTRVGFKHSLEPVSFAKEEIYLFRFY